MLKMFTRALKAEYIKTKASGLKWLCLGAALFIPLIMFLFYVSIAGTDLVDDLAVSRSSRNVLPRARGDNPGIAASDGVELQ